MNKVYVFAVGLLYPWRPNEPVTLLEYCGTQYLTLGAFARLVAHHDRLIRDNVYLERVKNNSLVALEQMPEFLRNVLEWEDDKVRDAMKQLIPPTRGEDDDEEEEEELTIPQEDEESTIPLEEPCSKFSTLPFRKRPYTSLLIPKIVLKKPKPVLVPKDDLFCLDDDDLPVEFLQYINQ